MRKWLIVLSLLSTSASTAPIWRWVDANGQVHYSDRPVPGAEQIEVLGAEPSPRARSAAESSRAPAVIAQAPRADETDNAQGAGGPYRTFNVVSPGQQDTLWNIGTVLNVTIELEPSLRTGHRLDVYFDGQRRNIYSTSPSFTVPDVFRGAHTLQAVVIDSQGAEVMRSQPVEFFVQQTSILNPNNPNAPRPRAPSGG